MPGTNLIIFDAVASLVHDNPDNTPLQHHLLASNSDFFVLEKKRIKDEQLSRVILAETRPQLPSTFVPAKYILPILQQHISNALPGVDVTFDPFWSVLTEQAKNGLNSIMNGVNDDNWTQELLDKTGIPDIVALANRAATTYSSEKITINVYAGSKQRYLGMENFFKEHTYLLPATCEVKFACYANHEYIYIPDAPAIKGTGMPNTCFKTDTAYTTALEWHKKSNIQASMLVTKNVTNELLGLARADEVAEEPVIDVEVVNNATKAPPSTFASLFSKPGAAPVAQKNSTPNTQFIEQFSRFTQDYKEGKITIGQFIGYTKPYQIRDKDEPAPTDIELIQVICNIAKESFWNQKGKTLNPLADKHKPDRIRSISESNPTTFGELANIVKTPPKKSNWLHQVVRDTVGDALHSRASIDFYALITAFDDPNSKPSNHAREVGLNAFCEKYNLDYKNLLEQSKAHAHRVSR